VIKQQTRGTKEFENHSFLALPTDVFSEASIQTVRNIIRIVSLCNLCLRPNSKILKKIHETKVILLVVFMALKCSLTI
jgi:hypothetical protein